MGELLIDFVALESDVSVGDASGFEKAPGGAPANVAVAVARLGHPASFIGKVGDDPFGEFLRAVLEAESVNVDGLIVSKLARTMLAFVSLGADGERSFVFYRHPSADMLMSLEDVRLDVIDKAQIFHFGSITIISEPSRSATLMAVDYARDNGLTISYDPNLRLDLWPDAEAAREGMLRGMALADVVKISEDEVRFLTGSDVITPLWEGKPHLIVVTHGAGGATAYLRGKDPVHVPGRTVDAVDTTGAGDSFTAGLLVGLLENPDTYGQRLDQLLAFANVCGAITTTHRGAIPALPLRDQVDEVLKCE